MVYRLDAADEPVAAWQSATDSADERVDLVAPDAATYLVLVDVFAAADGIAWDTTVISSKPDVGKKLTATSQRQTRVSS